MSVEAITVALNHSQARGTTKLVLIGIANHHSDNGAWPSVRTLAGYANLSERRIQQAIRELEELGEIRIDEQAGGGNRQYKTNRYWITISCPSDCAGFPNHRTGVKPVSPRGEADFASGVKPVSPEPLREPEDKPIGQEQFEIFWKAYPRSESKQEAKRAYLKAIKKISHDELMKSLERYKAHNTKNQIIFAYAATWLNGERYLDEYDAVTPASEQRDKALDFTRQFLAEQEEAAKRSAPPPKCEHGNSVVSCRLCLAS